MLNLFAKIPQTKVFFIIPQLPKVACFPRRDSLPPTNVHFPLRVGTLVLPLLIVAAIQLQQSRIVLSDLDYCITIV